MSNALELVAMSERIEEAFKSLIKSGRPDIVNENSESMIKDLYVDIFDNEYALKQVLDDNHLLLKGRRGTGKSTIFLRAEEILLDKENHIPIYLNLQTISAESPDAATDKGNEEFIYYRTYMNFMLAILTMIKEEIEKKAKWVDNDKLKKIFDDVVNGIHYDKDFESSIEITSTKKSGRTSKLEGALSTVAAAFRGEYGESHTNEEVTHEVKTEKRIFSIHQTLNDLVALLKRENDIKIYLLLDDFSELDESAQKIVIDSLVAPIISSYNKYFKVKIAAYPGRVYIGNIDTTKLPSLSLDFYDAFERILHHNKYTEIEKFAMDYIERTLRKRIDVYTDYSISLEEIFDEKKGDLNEYMKQMFYATACIPRAMGFILNYCYLSSINSGIRITPTHIENAAVKYFEENILNDFQNDIRFKQSFYDDDEILNHFAQINLKNKLVEKSKNIKKEIVQLYRDGNANKLFAEVLDKRVGSSYYFPTSHFYINTKREKLLKTLELYFIVSKFNQGSSRNQGERESFYALNYGLCMLEKIDFGKPENMRRSYDYWRQEEFDYNEYITTSLSLIEEIRCVECGDQYSELEYEIYQKRNNCLECGEHDSVKKVNKFAAKFKEKIEEWNKYAMPDSYIEILRVLFNNRGKKLSAYEIALQIDKHHATVTHAGNSLKSKGLLTYTVYDKRYYEITDIAISHFFTKELSIVD